LTIFIGIRIHYAKFILVTLVIRVKMEKKIPTPEAALLILAVKFSLVL